MKKLKKLKLKKETVVNLNDIEMSSIKGGSTAGCYYSAQVSWMVSGIAVSYIGEAIYNWYNKSKNPAVNVNGWVSRDHFEGYCCISDVEVVC